MSAEHNKKRMTKECVRLGLFLVLWIVVATGTVIEVILESQGIVARASIAVLAWFGGLVTYRLASLLWAMWHSDRKTPVV